MIIHILNSLIIVLSVNKDKLREKILTHIIFTTQYQESLNILNDFHNYDFINSILITFNPFYQQFVFVFQEYPKLLLNKQNHIYGLVPNVHPLPIHSRNVRIQFDYP